MKSQRWIRMRNKYKIKWSAKEIQTQDKIIKGHIYELNAALDFFLSFLKFKKFMYTVFH